MIPRGIPVRVDRTERGTDWTIRRAGDLMNELLVVLRARGDGAISFMDGSAFVRARLPDWPETLQVQVPSGMTPRAAGTDDTAYAIAVVKAARNAIERSDDVAASEAVEAHRGRGMAFLEAIGVDLDDPNARELTIYAPTPWMSGGQSMYPVGANDARTTAIRPVPDGPTMLVVYASKDIERDLITINVGGHFDQGVPSGPIARLRAAAAWQRHLASLGPTT